MPMTAISETEKGGEKKARDRVWKRHSREVGKERRRKKNGEKRRTRAAFATDGRKEIRNGDKPKKTKEKRKDEREMDCVEGQR